MNNYQYAPNPVGWVDPFGLECKELDPSVLDDKNLLGAGHFKEAFVISDEEVFLIPKRKVAHNSPHTIENLKQEAFLLDYLNTTFGLPTLKMNTIGVVNLPDGTQVKGLIAERKYFNGKDMVDIRRGKDPQGVTLADVYDTVTEETLDELKNIRERILKDQIVIDDLQIMYGKDGKPVIADPLDAYAGKYAEPEKVATTVERLDNNILMVKSILDKKK